MDDHTAMRPAADLASAPPMRRKCFTTAGLGQMMRSSSWLR
jgi:hypothetical protein